MRHAISRSEEDILKFWEDNRMVEKAGEFRPGAKRYVVYDGPPFATGTPHYGHLLAGTIKDVVPRYYTMLGHKIERRFGWDCHGLPVEFEAEKELGTRGKYDIEKMGIDKFNEYCRSIVMRYAHEWRYVVKRIGRWIDLNNDYKTLDTDFMESVWWVFKSLWDKGLIYQANRITAYSTRLSTPLSNFEVNLGYRMTDDPSVTIKFKSLTEENTYFLGWTTTPWTLPANLALCVNPEQDYLLLQKNEERFYIGKYALSRYSKEFSDAEVIKTLKGAALERMIYEPLFPFYAEYAQSGSFIVTVGEHVTDDMGTGIVHTAPMFGEDDHRIGKLYRLPEIMPVDDSGIFTDAAPPYKGLFFKDADKPIIDYLKANKRLLRQDTLHHNYPFCWRTDTPLMYRGIPSWFVNVEKIKELMLENNRKIHYAPDHIKEGRMGKWLEGARDWCISRNRYWGTPLPVWICENCKHEKCLGSRAELEQLSGKKTEDLHRHFIDGLTFPCEKCGGTSRRITEVLDCWFESGSMPYAQLHYPFENKEQFERTFPADFISEGIDQTRGWFYTLSVLSSALFGLPAYKNIIVSGLVMAEDGEKMSKRLKNYPDPLDMLNKYGADALRLYMLNSGAIKAEELRFAESGLIDTGRNNLIPLRHALSFFVTYANVDGWKPAETPVKSDNPLDIWLLSGFQELVQDVRTAMATYNLNKAVQPLVGFIDGLTNWYIRRSRRRFWKAGESADKYRAYETLYYTLKNFAKVIAPFMPFTAELIYSVLKTGSDPESVHLCDFPEVDTTLLNPELNIRMKKVMDAVSMGRFLRASEQIKIRQPLPSVSLVTSDPVTAQVIKEMQDQIREELNVKQVFIESNEEKLVTFSARPNLPKLGKQYGKMMKPLTDAVKALTSAQLADVNRGGFVTLTLDGAEVKLGKDDLLIDRHQKPGLLVQTKDDLVAALDTTLTPELIQEGLVREIINKIQNMRKNDGA
ncbi:hypothetical protein CHS0354_035283 [Potamilus streckersoni]|uniref:isoleucine--tRNA ligase n=1 Tax=Potamilus streckersoni TaxID=2493646 RepID=A0AAE0S2Q2_9BIVA|nr:hypothetical protein CHS0354_035283 [Potamilus streckersoni]